MSNYLAYAMAIYTLGSVYYMVRTRSVGTPFNDSLSEDQKKIKAESANVRRQIFMEGLCVSFLLMYATTPFKSC